MSGITGNIAVNHRASITESVSVISVWSLMHNSHNNHASLNNEAFLRANTTEQKDTKFEALIKPLMNQPADNPHLCDCIQVSVNVLPRGCSIRSRIIKYCYYSGDQYCRVKITVMCRNQGIRICLSPLR